MAIPKQDWLSDAIDEEAGAYEGALYDTVKGDKLPKLKQKREEKKKKKSGLGSFLGMAGSMFGSAVGGPAGGMAGSMAGRMIGEMASKEGGQIESNLKTQKKNTAKKKRVVRGVGAAKRGYGKATYSKNMY